MVITICEYSIAFSLLIFGHILCRLHFKELNGGISGYCSVLGRILCFGEAFVVIMVTVKPNVDPRHSSFVFCLGRSTETARAFFQVILFREACFSFSFLLLVPAPNLVKTFFLLSLK